MMSKKFIYVSKKLNLIIIILCTFFINKNIHGRNNINLCYNLNIRNLSIQQYDCYEIKKIYLDRLQLFTDTILSKDLFNFKDSIYCKSNYTFITNESGSMTQQVIKGLNDTTNINLYYLRNTAPNPINIETNYQIYKTNNSYFVNIKASLPIELLYLDKNLNINYNGNNIEFPQSFLMNEILPSVKGRLDLCIDKKCFISYDISLSNRKIIKKDLIIASGKILEAYVHTYNIKISTISNNKTFFERNETINEWIVPSLGIIKQERSGNEITDIKNLNQNRNLQQKQTIQTLKFKN